MVFPASNNNKKKTHTSIHVEKCNTIGVFSFLFYAAIRKNLVFIAHMLSLLETILFPLIKQVCLGTSQVDNFRTAISLQYRNLIKDVVSIKFYKCDL